MGIGRVEYFHESIHCCGRFSHLLPTRSKTFHAATQLAANGLSGAVFCGDVGVGSTPAGSFKPPLQKADGVVISDCAANVFQLLTKS